MEVMVYARPACGVPQDELSRKGCEGCKGRDGCRAWSRGGVFYEETVDDIVREMEDPAKVRELRSGISGGVSINCVTSVENVVSRYARRITDAIDRERAKHAVEIASARKDGLKELERLKDAMVRISDVDISAAGDFDFTDGCGGEDFGDVSMYCLVDDGYCGHNQITDDVRDAILRGFTAVQETQRMLKGEHDGND